MKYAIKELTGNIGTLQRKGSEISNNITEDTEKILLENPLLEYSAEGLEVGNSCIGIKTYMLEPKIAEAVNKQLKLSQEKINTFLYGFFNGTEFSDILELCVSKKFMNHNIGMDTDIPITGGAYKVSWNLKEAIPQWEAFQTFLTKINYKGEVTVGLSSTSSMVAFYCGHNSPAFACYYEIHKTNVEKDARVIENILDFIFGSNPICKVFDCFALFNVVSTAPFPYSIPGIQGKEIAVPKNAERHTWKVRCGFSEIVIVMVHGDSTKMAQGRLRSTINNMLNYDSELQFRTDYGVNLEFVLSQEKHESYLKKSKFVQIEKRKPEQSQAETESKVQETVVLESNRTEKELALI